MLQPFSLGNLMVIHARILAMIFVCTSITPAFAQSQRKPIVLEPSPERNAAPWSDAVLDGDTLYLSGYIGVDPKTLKPPTSAKDEARLALDDLKHTIESQGMTMDDLVKVEVFG